MMRIGVDIDGVLNDIRQLVLVYGTKFCLEETGECKIINPDTYSTREMFGWDEKMKHQFWLKNAKYQMMLCSAQTYAADVIKKLHNEGHEIWIVTGREDPGWRFEGMPDGKTWQDVTEDWLHQNGIEYDKIHFDTQNKGEFCCEQGIDVMIEDDPYHLRTFDATTKLLIMDQTYNRDYATENSERVYTWYDIYSKIQKVGK